MGISIHKVGGLWEHGLLKTLGVPKFCKCIRNFANIIFVRVSSSGMGAFVKKKLKVSSGKNHFMDLEVTQKLQPLHLCGLCVLSCLPAESNTWESILSVSKQYNPSTPETLFSNSSLGIGSSSSQISRSRLCQRQKVSTSLV